ncbi:hypothetical protein [Hymenobacter pini]|uniref:hypothetical protein n=1 Tax=Hymenobacter pini TaxID=2880879 RepID=UPI001CF2C847|nr:hypothetical protein [Hymenobacter pini]MCA8831950.1 hypothetical protein [Hymenobacter pini]
MAELTRQQFIQKWDARFATNQFENITEATFREFKADIMDTFAPRRELTTNMIRGGLYRIPNIDALGTIPEGMLIIGMEALAVNGAGAAEAGAGIVLESVYFKLIEHSQGEVIANRSINPEEVDTYPARWVRVSGTEEEKIASYPTLLLEDQPHKKGDIVKWTFPNGQTRLLEFKADQQGQYNPEPTGEDDDPNYINFAPLGSEVAEPVSMDILDALDITTGAVPATFKVGVLYQITGRDGGFVRLQAIDARALALDDAYEFQNDSTWKPVRYDLVNDIALVRQSGGASYTDGQAVNAALNSGLFVGNADPRLGNVPLALRIDSAGNITRYTNVQSALDSMAETDACYISGYHAFLRFYRPGTYYCAGAVVEAADLGYYPNGDVAGQKITVYGLSWRKRLCLLVQGAGPSTYRLVNCTGGPNAWVDFFLGFGHRYYSQGDDAWTFEGLRMHYTGAYVPYTQSQTGVGTVTGRGSGLFRYPAGVNQAQVCKLSLLDCALKSDSGPIFSGAAYQADTIRLQGSTTVTPGGGKPVAEFTDLQTGADMTAPTLAALLLDERPVQSGGGSANVDLSNYYTKSESNTRFASYLQIRSTATARVREVPVPAVLQIQSETLDQNAASLSYQLDKNTRVGNRQYGSPDQTLAQVNALLASLSAGELLAGVKLYVKTIPNVAADAATVGLTLL